MSVTTEESAGAAAIRPFTVEIPEAEIETLRARVTATRWPHKELVGDWSQGVQLAMLQELARYWAADYDWRKCEAELNALPQFTTEIDGLGIHFIHVKSRHENALPLIITHGWPGSVIEMLGIVGQAGPGARGANLPRRGEQRRREDRGADRRVRHPGRGGELVDAVVGSLVDPEGLRRGVEHRQAGDLLDRRDPGGNVDRD